MIALLTANPDPISGTTYGLIFEDVMGGKRIHSKIYNDSYATRDGYDFRFRLCRIVHNRSCNEWKETVHLETLKGQRTLGLAME